MGLYPGQPDLYNILTRDLKLDGEKGSIFISSIKQITPDIYKELKQDIRIQARTSEKDIHDLLNKMLMNDLVQFYLTVAFIMLILFFIK